MTRSAVLALAVVLTSLLVTLFATACGTQSASQSAQDGSSEHTQAEAPLTGSAEDFERAQFDDPTDIDN